MNEYIKVDVLRNAMYHEAFETDTKMQRWDSGCWIRYKLFDNVLDQLPTADVVEVVRCKDCEHRFKNKWFCRDGRCLDDEQFCGFGERREDDKG